MGRQRWKAAARGFALGMMIVMAFPPAARAETLPPLGVQDDWLLVHGWTKVQGDPFAYAGYLGARWVRINAQLQRPLGPYVAAAANAKAHGLRVYVTLTGQQRLATPGKTAWRAWTRRAAVELAPYADAYSLWNEPDHPAFSPGPVKTYCRLFRDGAARVRAVDPTAKILLGETSPRNTFTFLRQLRRCGAPLVADGWAHHPYQWDTAPTAVDHTGNEAPISRLGTLHAQLRRARPVVRTRAGGTLPLWITEYGYPDRKIPAAKRARWFCQSWKLAGRAGARMFLAYQLLPFGGQAWDSSVYNRPGKSTPETQALRSCGA